MRFIPTFNERLFWSLVLSSAVGVAFVSIAFDNPTGTIIRAFAGSFGAAALLALLSDTFQRLSNLIRGVVENLRESPGNVPYGSADLTTDGVVRVYQRRHDKAMKDIRKDWLEQVHKRSGQIVACGVSLREIFSLSHGFSDQFCHELAGGGNGVQVAVALLNIKSSPADFRNALEDNQPTRDFESVKKVFDRHFQSCSDRVSYGLYDSPPKMFAVVFDEIAYVQRYISCPPDDKTLWTEGVCYGDYTPVFAYRVNTDGYRIVRDEVMHVLADECHFPVQRPEFLRPARVSEVSRAESREGGPPRFLSSDAQPAGTQDKAAE